MAVAAPAAAIDAFVAGHAVSEQRLVGASPAPQPSLVSVWPAPSMPDRLARRPTRPEPPTDSAPANPPARARRGDPSERRSSDPLDVPGTAAPCSDWRRSRPASRAPMMRGTPGMSLSDSVSERLLRERIIILGSEVRDHECERDHRAAVAARRRGSREGHHPLHQLAGRQRHRRHGDLRHDDADRAGRRDHRDGSGGVDGPVPAHGGRAGQARRAAAHPDPDAPALARASAAQRRTSRSRRRC